MKNNTASTFRVPQKALKTSWVETNITKSPALKENVLTRSRLGRTPALVRNSTGYVIGGDKTNANLY